jgi:hypothetical protein
MRDRGIIPRNSFGDQKSQTKVYQVGAESLLCTLLQVSAGGRRSAEASEVHALSRIILFGRNLSAHRFALKRSLVIHLIFCFGSVVG